MRFIILAFNAFMFIMLLACARQPEFPPPPVSGESIVIERPSLRLGDPAFYTYRLEEKKINFFVMEMDGKVLSFFDACDTCYKEKRGFKIEGEYVICRACNERHRISKIEKGVESCFPLRLEGNLDGDRYIISLASVIARKNIF